MGREAGREAGQRQVAAHHVHLVLAHLLHVKFDGLVRHLAVAAGRTGGQRLLRDTACQRTVGISRKHIAPLSSLSSQSLITIFAADISLTNTGEEGFLSVKEF